MQLYVWVEDIPQNILSEILPIMRSSKGIEYVNGRHLSIESDNEENIIEKLVSYLIDKTKIHYFRTVSGEKHTKIKIAVDMEELTDYIENGNVKNSVNLPELVLKREKD